MKFRFFSQTSLPILQTRFCQVFLEESSKIPRNQMYSKIRFSFLSNSSPYSIRKEHVSQKREKKKKKASFAKILFSFSLRISFLICRHFIVSIENEFFSWLDGNSRREKWNDLRVLKASLRS